MANPLDEFAKKDDEATPEEPSSSNFYSASPPAFSRPQRWTWEEVPDTWPAPSTQAEAPKTTTKAVKNVDASVLNFYYGAQPNYTAAKLLKVKKDPGPSVGYKLSELYKSVFHDAPKKDEPVNNEFGEIAP